MNNEYRLKYLKYKVKYNKLRNQLGGAIIHHFYHRDKIIGMSEAITHNSLKEQMTQHGMGTGIYGFINHTTEDAKIYNREPNLHALFTLRNPIILENKWEEDGEERNESDLFTWLSIHLNGLCTKLYNESIPITNEKVIELLNSEYLYQNDNGTFDGIPRTIITIDDIVNITRIFLDDYKMLMSTSPEEENYMLLPINYLTYLKNFDGVLNKLKDIPSVGSIKYIFDNSYGARGYLPQFKRMELLRGRLIFSRERLDALKI